jgi:uncharacterized Fe-S cluster-containing radical SAM superfamily protein
MKLPLRRQKTLSHDDESSGVVERMGDTGFDLTKLYRLPYTKTDNPNTVIEPTTRCNLSCPGCYRRTYLANNEERDMSLDEMRQYIDDVARLRNSSYVSFLGGEPLVHPQVNDAIAYAKQLGFNVGLYTNGLLLDDQRLKELRDLEVSYIKIHVDKHQGRGDTEEKTNQLREHFCDMFRRVGGVRLAFTFQLREVDLPDIPAMVECFTRNADIVRAVSFVGCTNATPKDAARSYAERVEAELTMCKAVKDAYGLKWNTYIGKKFSEKLPGKIMALCAYREGEMVASVESDVIREKTMWAYDKYGKYPYIERLPWPYAENKPGQKIYWQYILFGFSPMLGRQGMNFCNSCTDALLYKGKFLPMCILEHVITNKCSSD